MNKKYKANGSITVFLSMTLLIIISLVMTTAEALRAYSMTVYTERALYTALDSIFAEFYYPLFKEYHVFGLDGGYGDNLIQKKIIEDKVMDYMDHTFYPSNNISFGNFDVPMHSFNMFDINTKKTNVEDIKTLIDHKGDLFRDQAIDYTRYSLAAEGVEKLLEQANLIKDKDLKGIVTTQEVLEKKIVVEEKVSLINDDMIYLSDLLDGITITKDGPILNNEGRLYIKEGFVKKICNDNEIMLDPYPTNPWVSSSLKGKYSNPTREINKCLELLNSLIENKETREEGQLINDFIDSLKEIKNLISSTSRLISDTIVITNRLIRNQNKLSQLIADYESSLLEKKKDIGKKLYSSLWSEYLELEKYKDCYSGNSNYYNFTGMQNTLTKNQAILEEAQKIIDIKISSKEDTWSKAKSSLNQVNNILSKYSHKNLNLDYRLLRKKEEEIDIFKGINNIISDGLMEFILPDTNNISEKSIEEVEKNILPSYKYKNKELLNSNNGIGELSLTNYCKEFREVLNCFTNNYNGKELLISSADSIGGSLLYQKYILDHFGSYQSERKVNMPTSLDYEVEYILQGKDSDSENLKSFIFNLFVFRTLMNTVSLITNPESNEQARILAISLVGFLGQPILVTTTKTIILFVWGLAESIVDISALLQEKSVAFLKQIKDFELDLKDLPFLKKEFIQIKVNKMKGDKSPQDLNYEDYLNIMLLFKTKNNKTFQALDLIQINLQNNYEDSFLISNCIYGIRVSADFSMEQKLISLPFIEKIISTSSKVYSHNTIREYSY